MTATSAPFVSIEVLLSWATRRFGWVAVRNDAQHVGKSNDTLGKLDTQALTMATGFTIAPLRLLSFVGFGMSLFGICMLAHVLGGFALEGGGVPGFPFLASALAILSGAQMFAVGIIGEYPAPIHVRTMDRPAYAISECIGGTEVTGVSMNGHALAGTCVLEASRP